jgi:hypothetical protein
VRRTGSTLRVYEKLLLAAADLERSGKSPFSAEDLVVSAWHRDPETFGLSGYTDENGRPLYPNSNRVFAEIMGSSKPIRKQGLISKSGTKMFHLTEPGRQRAAVLRSESGDGAAAKATFSRETRHELQKILASRAVTKYQDGRLDDITFHDASSLWGISARSSGNHFRSQVANVEGVLTAAAEAAANRPIVLEHGSQEYSGDDIQGLLELHRFLLERFEPEIAVIVKRRDW